MLEMKNAMGFDGVLYSIPMRIAALLKKLPTEIKEQIQEIRLRRNCPVTLTLSGRSVWVDKGGYISFFLRDNLVMAYGEDVEECFRLLCKGSVYSHEQEIKKGFIRMNGGHRAGICGRVIGASFDGITSVNIRIARQILGAADSVISAFNGNGMLIAGAPGSGKTTVLRDLIRQLSDGCIGRYYKIAVIDTRGEISGSGAKGTTHDLGPGCDVLLDCDKAQGMEIAVRTLGVDFIAFDELGTREELEGIKQCLHTGVSVITTAHAGSPKELTQRTVTRELLDSGAISTVVFLKEVGKSPEIYNAETLNRI